MILKFKWASEPLGGLLKQRVGTVLRVSDSAGMRWNLMLTLLI